MDVNSILDGFRNTATAHPYLGLAILLFLIGALVRGKASLVFYLLGFIALLQEFSLFDVFVDFLKTLPDKISALMGSLGGV
ncbi:t26-9p [Thermococcus litoralis DSM 5473]|uniref:T26-9p n=1 Tax=Thermococcus litoralis (strain ATCC 51850 / DSM 5473 / JCM 8560 / NS-C) TaxID=523849 RepID=H3ZPZ2_THELN|nr:hypothetical protein [Thermococcus litoralis]EHR77955.1 t26-9p [Thermococcus litoralis DSM 5473]